jgi:hypothetical protein
MIRQEGSRLIIFNFNKLLYSKESDFFPNHSQRVKEIRRLALQYDSFDCNALTGL